MMAMGVPQEIIDEARSREKPEDETCWVWEENWNSVLFFLRLKTQWRQAGMGGFTGLDYTGTEAVMRMMRIPHKDREMLLNDVQVMEFAALEVLNKKETE